MSLKPGGGNPTVAKLYETVIDDVITNIKESFLNDGVDDQVLQELKRSWEAKLRQTKAIDSPVVEEKALGRMGPLYRYTVPHGGNVVYQQLSNPSQQATIALQGYQKGGNVIQVPTNASQQQVFRTYQQPVILQGQTVQLAQPTGASGSSTNTLVLARTNQPNTTASNSSANQQADKQGPSAIIQVDGANDELNEESHCSLQADIATVKDNNHVDNKSSKMKKLVKIKPSNKFKNTKHPVEICLQLDGAGDSSSDDDEEDESDNDSESEEEETKEEGVEEEPLCTDDDDSDQSADELFDTDNVMVCQYDKIHRAKSKWKFTLKMGIMNLKGRDETFQKATGEAEW